MLRVSNAFEDYTSIKPLNKNKHNKFLIMLERNLINVHSKTRPQLALQNENRLAVYWPFRICVGRWGVSNLN